MARKNKSKQAPEDDDQFDGLSDEVKRFLIAAVFIALAVFFFLASFSMAGAVGDFVYKWLDMFVGFAYYLLPILLTYLSIIMFRDSRPRVAWRTALGSGLFFFSGLGIAELLHENSAGFLGRILLAPMLKLFDVWFSAVIFITLFIISIVILQNTRPRFHLIQKLLTMRRERLNENLDSDDTEEVAEGETDDQDDEAEEDEADDEAEEEDVPAPSRKKKSAANSAKNFFGLGRSKYQSYLDSVVGEIEFTPPPLELLSEDAGRPTVGDIKANTNLVKKTLENFGINVEMDEVTIGPTVTRYSLKPAQGVKLSRIVGLQNDLSLALAAHPLRIEAPIPGKSLVGIEIPNIKKSMIGLGSLLSDDEFAASPHPLLMALGKDITGRTHFANLAKMPHLLIAGQTGSGKSVTVHALINSLLFRNPPENLRFLMVDPKRVELTLYNDMPHLMTPVIKDPKKAIAALAKLVKEMERRYNILEAEKVRDIQSYHKTIYGPAVKQLMKEQARSGRSTKDDEAPEDEATPLESTLPERLPYIVIVIDELADIMTAYPREMEQVIVRLAQMSRAVGIHLILSTQRPSVNIITGIIKANIPGRIALQVASLVDSRTILDASGAEKLLGQGDMLYISGDMSQPVRLQSAFISEAEIKRVTSYIKENFDMQLPDNTMLRGDDHDIAGSIFNENPDDEEDEDTEDDMTDSDRETFERARELVIQHQRASTTFLQTKLGIGYAKAARIIEFLADASVIGPPNGSKPREVLLKPHTDEDQFPEDIADDMSQTEDDERQES